MIKLYDPDISEDDRRFVYKVLCDGKGLTNVEDGYIRMFEKSVEKYLGVKHAIAVSSGTAALHLALWVLEHTVVYSSAFTFPAVRNMIQEAGHTFVSVDIDPKTYNMDFASIDLTYLYPNRAILVPHMFGQSARMAYIDHLLSGELNDVMVIEDAACSLGAKYKGEFCGTIAPIGCFSFHPRKIITTGEGGMVVTNDDRYAKKFRSWRNHGLATNELGFNYRMSEMAGALGYSQMKRLKKTIERRRQIAAVYNSAFDIYDKEKKVIPPFHVRECFHIYQSYVVRLTCKNMDPKDLCSDYSGYRNGVIEKLREKGIGSTIGSYCLDDRKIESRLAAQLTIALPIHTQMSDDDAFQVAKTLLEVL